MDAKDASSETLEGYDEYVIGNLRKNNLYYKVERNFAKLCPDVRWKAEL